MNTLQQQIIDYLQTNHTLGEKVDPSADFMEASILDSMGIMDLVLWVETDLGVKIPNEDMSPEKVGTVERLSAYVEANRKTP